MKAFTLCSSRQPRMRVQIPCSCLHKIPHASHAYEVGGDPVSLDPTRHWPLYAAAKNATHSCSPSHCCIDPLCSMLISQCSIYAMQENERPRASASVLRALKDALLSVLRCRAPQALTWHRKACIYFLPAMCTSATAYCGGAEQR